jgi:molybdenum cofactor cytidylyltransferase
MPRVGVIILAAGESIRLGEPKQLVKFRGHTLIRYVANIALNSNCLPVVVVLGANAELIETEIPRDARVVKNSDWKEGMASSIRCGLNAIETDVDAVILILCDQPLLTAETLNRFAELASAGLVAAEYNGTIGVPALFGRRFFDELRSLTGKEGAKKILLAHHDEVVRIPCPEAALDIDTDADVHRLQTFE